MTIDNKWGINYVLPDDYSDTVSWSNTQAIYAYEPTPYFIQTKGVYKLTIDAPGFGKPEDSLEVKVIPGRILKVLKNGVWPTSYGIPDDLDIDTLSVVVEFGQILVTAEAKKSEDDSRSIPIHFRR